MKNADTMTINTSDLRPNILTFAGSDSSSLAGIQTDIKTQSALGAHCLSAVTAITAQNNNHVLAINPVEMHVLNEQIQSVSPYTISAVKSGLLASGDQITCVANTVKALSVPFVCDPVLAASSGQQFVDDNLELIKNELIPVAELVTPNIPEAEKLTGLTIESTDDIEHAARLIFALGAKAVYIKGGHAITQSEYVHDYFYSASHAFWLTSKKLRTENTRGTGCAYASSVTAAIARGYPTVDAVVIAKMAINQGLRNSYSLSGLCEKEKGPVNITHFPHAQEDLPYLTKNAQFNFDFPPFLECDGTPLGLYPVVDSADWLARLLPLGVTTAQIRNKTLSGSALEAEIKRAIEIGKEYNCRLFINDYWELAIKHNAYGVHLGQEDLDEADIHAIRAAGVRLGTSTHCHYEVARAHALKPSYIACGPVYETTTKDMHLGSPWPEWFKLLAVGARLSVGRDRRY